LRSELFGVSIHHVPPVPALAVAVAAAAVVAISAQQDGPLFRSGVDLVDVTVTVTDSDERFVSGLQRDDFRIYEDGVLQETAYFSNERVPVSLGIALDTSGSMTSDKMASARSAINRFAGELLGAEDELFYMQFANRPDLVQDWTHDRRAIRRALGSAFAAGGTALYDAIAEAVPVAQTGQNKKKAMLVISDGNDTTSETTVEELQQIIRESEVLVYALAVDGRTDSMRRPPIIQIPQPFPFPIPGRRQPPVRMPPGVRTRIGEGVNAGALRRITDPTGGRTEVLRGFDDLDGATSRIADELSKQYQLGYASNGKRDGRWHAIRVEVSGRGYTVRARGGFVAARAAS
jgi:Ca-activated chloride channel family protein